MTFFFGAAIHALTYYMSEFIHKVPVFEEEIEQVSILQNFQKMHVAIIST